MNGGEAKTGLRRLVHHVSEIELGERTSFDDARLCVSEREAAELFEDPALASVRLACVSPA